MDLRSRQHPTTPAGIPAAALTVIEIAIGNPRGRGSCRLYGKCRGKTTPAPQPASPPAPPAGPAICANPVLLQSRFGTQGNFELDTRCSYVGAIVSGPNSWTAR